MKPVDDIIQKLGGPKEAARLTGTGTEAIRKWRQSGIIPSRHWNRILQHTDLSLSDLTPNQLLSSSTPASATAILVLADGTVFWGYGAGIHTDPIQQKIGEICFCTGMTGYQETMTDPSYAGQIITFTFPHIGIVGTNCDDNESSMVHASGLIFSQPLAQASNWRSEEPLSQWLHKKGATALFGIDTRVLTLIIRDRGPQNAVLSFPKDGQFCIQSLTKRARSWSGLKDSDLTQEVASLTPYTWNTDRHHFFYDANISKSSNKKWHVVVIDYGVKNNILRCLISVACRVTVVPSHTSIQDIMHLKPDGVVLSNGPGDPAATAHYALPIIHELLQMGVPIFGICLGHQLLALALGAKTFKLPQGHHGANQPVKNLLTKKVEITSQNHNFAADISTFPTGVTATHVSLFDGCNEGLRSEHYPAFSVQFHPEASPGPTDSFYLFKDFTSLMARCHRQTTQLN